jgi:lipopolysaccharide export system permease protein
LLAAGESSHERLAQAEWHNRLAKPVSVFVLALFALVFAYVRPRGGRYTGMFVAVLVYFLYLNALSVGDAMIKSGRAPGSWGLWWAHGLFLLLALAALWQRANNRSLWSLPSFARGT